ncbi:mCG18358, isoform CRA_a, partial [Mus musculus]
CPRVPSSFARPELSCSRRPERRGRSTRAGPHCPAVLLPRTQAQVENYKKPVTEWLQGEVLLHVVTRFACIPL